MLWPNLRSSDGVVITLEDQDADVSAFVRAHGAS